MSDTCDVTFSQWHPVAMQPSAGLCHAVCCLYMWAASVINAAHACAAAAARTEAQQDAVWAFEAWRRAQLPLRREAMLAAAQQRMSTLEALALSRETARQRDIAAATARVTALRDAVLRKTEDLEGREARLQVCVSTYVCVPGRARLDSS